MDRGEVASIRLFSYGTLQMPEVQRANYGRLLEGRPDVLAGYALRPLPITDPDVACQKAFHRVSP